MWIGLKGSVSIHLQGERVGVAVGNGPEEMHQLLVTPDMFFFNYR